MCTDRLLLALSLLLALPLLPGCDRLNPEWCTKHASCGAGQYCDPVSNSCRAREAGLPVDAAPVDTDVAAEQPPRVDSTVDQRPSEAGGDLTTALDGLPADALPPDHGPADSAAEQGDAKAGDG